MMNDKAFELAMDLINDIDKRDDEIWLDRQKRFDILRDNMASDEVFKYLENKFQALTIEVCGDYTGLILDLMKQKALEGWCWQTTESAIVFLLDDDYIERGNLVFDKYTNYWHSWINFHVKNMEYTFDPCLNILCERKLYQEVFETDLKGIVNASIVRDKLIDSILNPKPKKISNSPGSIFAENFMKKYFGDSLERQKDEVRISGNDDVTSPMYRNSTGYIAEIKDGKIKKLVAHYYGNG